METERTTQEAPPDEAPPIAEAIPDEEKHEEVRVPRDRPLGTLHQGSRYSFGFSPMGYGIWDNLSSGAPVESFPASKAGRMTGWERYVQMEPEAEEASKQALLVDNPPPEVTHVGGLRRWRWAIVLGVIVVAIGAFVLTRNKGGTTGGGIQAKAGSVAHVNVSGGTTASGTLAQSAYKPQGIGTLYPIVNATWAGNGVTVNITMSQPQVPGDNQTSQVSQTTLSIQVTPAGSTTPATYFSDHGECTITVNRLDDNGFTGKYTCTAIPAQSGTGTVDATGDFEASPTS